MTTAISEKLSETNETVKNNTIASAKSHKTIQKSYLHFTELTETSSKNQTNSIQIIDNKINDLTEINKSNIKTKSGNYKQIILNPAVITIRLNLIMK